MSQHKNMLQIIEKIILCILFVIVWYALIYQPAEPVFMGEFNNRDGSLYVARFADTAFALLIFFTVAFTLVPRFLVRRKLTHFILWSVAILISVVVCEYMFDRLLLKLFHLPSGPNEISDKMMQYPRRIVFKAPIIPGNLLIYTLGLLYGISRDWILKTRRQSRLSTEKLKADIDLLRSQINPHFFFNALNNIYAITQRNKDQDAGEAIMRLSTVMRYMIYDSDVDAIGLDTEIEQMQKYVELMRLRYAEEDPIDLRIRQEGDLKSLRIAPLILLPFVENAFKHGLTPKGVGFIHIDIRVAGKKLFFRICNSKAGRIKSFRKHPGIGLDNVVKRLELQYPGQFELRVSDKKETYCADLSINLE